MNVLAAASVVSGAAPEGAPQAARDPLPLTPWQQLKKDYVADEKVGEAIRVSVQILKSSFKNEHSENNNGDATADIEKVGLSHDQAHTLFQDVMAQEQKLKISSLWS